MENISKIFNLSIFIPLIVHYIGILGITGAFTFVFIRIKQSDCDANCEIKSVGNKAGIFALSGISIWALSIIIDIGLDFNPFTNQYLIFKYEYPCAVAGGLLLCNIWIKKQKYKKNSESNEDKWTVKE